MAQINFPRKCRGCRKTLNSTIEAGAHYRKSKRCAKARPKRVQQRAAHNAKRVQAAPNGRPKESEWVSIRFKDPSSSKRLRTLATLSGVTNQEVVRLLVEERFDEVKDQIALKLETLSSVAEQIKRGEL